MFNSYFPESQWFHLTSACAQICWRLALFFKQANTANHYFSSCLLGVISSRHRFYKVICDSRETTGLDCLCCLCVKCNLHVGDSSFSSANHHHFFLRASSAVSNVWTVSQCQHTKGTLHTSNTVYLNWTLQKNIPHKWSLQRSKSASAWFWCCLASSCWAGWCFLSTQWQADSTCTEQLVPKASSLHPSTFRGKELHLTLSTKQHTRARVSLLVSDWRFHRPAILKQRKATEPQTNKKPV